MDVYHKAHKVFAEIILEAEINNLMLSEYLDDNPSADKDWSKATKQVVRQAEKDGESVNAVLNLLQQKYWDGKIRRSNPVTTSVLGALIVGGIIGHSMKK